MVFETLETAKQSGLTLIVIEQFAHKALAVADRCVILRGGAISWEGTASEAQAQLVARSPGTGGAQRDRADKQSQQKG